MDQEGRLNIDRSAAKKYFKGAGIWPWLLIIVGIPLAFIVVGLFMIVGGIVWLLVVYFSAGAYERQIDQIIAAEQEHLLKRGAEKLGLIDEQIGLIEPIRTVGMGRESALLNDAASGGFFSFFKKSSSQAPVLKIRFNSEGEWRFSLIQVNIFMFDDKQLYVYFANVDITTGLIYSEGTHECFYKDICGLSTEQELTSKFNPKSRKFVTVPYEYIKVLTSGHQLSATIDTAMSNSALDEQFSAMRNLVREKKEER